MPASTNYVLPRPSVSDTASWTRILQKTRITQADFRQILQVQDSEFSELLEICCRWQKEMVAANSPGFAEVMNHGSKHSFQVVKAATLQWLQNHDIWGTPTRFRCDHTLVPPAALQKAADLISYCAMRMSRSTYRDDAVPTVTRDSLHTTIDAPPISQLRSSSTIESSSWPIQQNLATPKGRTYNDLRTATVRLRTCDGGETSHLFVFRSLFPDRDRNLVIDAWDVRLSVLTQKLTTFSNQRTSDQVNIESCPLYLHPSGVRVQNDDELTSILLDFMRGHFQDNEHALSVCFGTPTAAGSRKQSKPKRRLLSLTMT